jgi:hypothetical protein
MAQECAHACPEFPPPQQEVIEEDKVQDPMIGGHGVYFSLGLVPTTVVVFLYKTSDNLLATC